MSNPMKDYKYPGERVMKKERIITLAKRGKFWGEYRVQALKARVNVGLVMFTAARSGEVHTVRVCDVFIDAKTVRRRIWKEGDDFTVIETKIPRELMDDIVKWIELKGLSGEQRLLPIGCQAGVKFLRRWGTSFRGLRRTGLEWFREEGVDLAVIQKAAGHSKLTTTQKYLGVVEGHVNTALEVLDWQSLGGGPENTASSPD